MDTTASTTCKRHLMLDPALLTQADGVALRVNEPEARQIVIPADRPWEGKMITLFLSFMEEQGKIRLWYICRDKDNQPNVAYAESTDGVHWEKPNLGIVDYHGSTDNNLVGIHHLEGVVYRDPHAANADEAYVYVSTLRPEGVVRFTSPDGLHWVRDHQPLLPFRCDTQNVTYWDPTLQRYVLFMRGWDISPGWDRRYRTVVRLTLPTLAKPAGIKPTGQGRNPNRNDDLPRIVDEVPTVFAADEHDPPNVDVYNMSVQPYPLDPRWLVAFPSFFQREKHISDGRLEVQFAGSRDGITWHRYDRKPYLRPGLVGTHGSSMVFMGTGLVARGDELWQFGIDLNTRHGGQHDGDGAIFRCVHRIDGFVSADFAAAGGTCTTDLVTVDGNHLLLNVDTAALGEISVGLLDADHQPIEGYSLQQCDPIQINATAFAATWEGHSDLSALKGRPIRLHFSGNRAKLYSFSFSNTDPGA